MFSETTLIILISLAILKPKDITLIIKNIHSIKNVIKNTVVKIK